MNKNKGFIGIGLILAIILGIVVVGGGAYYFGTKKNIKIEKSQSEETKNLNRDLYPLYQNLSWGSEVPSSQDTRGLKLSGFKIVSKNILDGEYYKLDTSFEKYYDTKLTSLGWVRDDQFQADGAGSSSWSYLKGDERIIFYYNSKAINQKPNEPLSCPCNMVFEIFSGKENIDKTKITNTITQINSEESSTESFKNQPGAIKSIKSNGTNKWTFAVDLLSRNSKWTPGDDNEPFFLNQNTKIRNLNVNSSTKTYECGDSPDTGAFGPFILSNTLNIIKQIQPDDIKYFDINGTNITYIYEQCLP